MTEEVFTTNSPKAIEGLIEDWSSFAPASRALDGITTEQALTRLTGWPHSIAEIVAHMLFWQKHDLLTIETGIESKATDAESWLSVTVKDWPRLKDDFLASLEKSCYAAMTENLDRLILNGKFSVGLRMVWFTGHNAYHLGQIVLLRRILGVWPTPNRDNI